MLHLASKSVRFDIIGPVGLISTSMIKLMQPRSDPPKVSPTEGTNEVKLDFLHFVSFLQRIK